MTRQTFIAGLFIIGTSLVITAISAYFWRSLLEQPAGLFGLFITVFLAIASLLGGTVREWANNIFGNKEKTTGAKRQINVGDNITNVIAHKFVQNVFESSSDQDSKAFALFTIPRPVQDFTGREKELEQLKSEFNRGVVITGISGGGGVGKTELARKLADEIKDSYPDGRISIDLLGTSEALLAPDEAMHRLLEAFYPDRKLPNDPNQLKGLYQQTFASQKVLILLDNTADAKQVRSLIPPLPSAAIVTSRQHFSLTEFGLKEPLRLGVLSLEESRQLLRLTSEKINRSSDEEVDKLVELCGYLPLALRVAASILNDRPDWTLETLLWKLADERTRLQRLKRPDDPDLDVEAAIGLSYRLLPNEDKKHFRMLSVFADLFWIEPVAFLLGLEHEEDAEKPLGVLITRSLINSYPHQFRQFGTNNTRSGSLYNFHDLTRLYASSRLYENVEEAKTAIERHARFFLDLAIFANKEYLKGKEYITYSLRLFRMIWSDLFLAWQRMLPNQSSATRPESAYDFLLSFPINFANMLQLQVSSTQNIAFLETALETWKTRRDKSDERDKPGRPEGMAVPLEVGYLNNLGDAYVAAGKMHNAISVLEEAWTKLDADDATSELSRKYMKASIFANMGNANYGLGNLEKAVNCWQQQLTIASDIHDRLGQTNAFGNVGNAYTEFGDLLLGVGYYQKQLAMAREIGSREHEEFALGNMGVTFSKWGESQKSQRLHEQALDIAHERGDVRREGMHIVSLGSCYADLGDFDKAIKTYKQGLVYHRMAGDYQMEAGTLINLGTAYFCIGEKSKTKESWQDALAIYQSIGHPRVQQVQDWLNKMDFDPQKLGTPTIYLPELIQAVIDAAYNKAPVAVLYFEAISILVNDLDITVEFRELVSILQKILIGIKNPDLSHLPNELASLVREGLEKRKGDEEFQAKGRH